MGAKAKERAKRLDDVSEDVRQARYKEGRKAGKTGDVINMQKPSEWLVGFVDGAIERSRSR